MRESGTTAMSSTMTPGTRVQQPAVAQRFDLREHLPAAAVRGRGDGVTVEVGRLAVKREIAAENPLRWRG